MALITYRKTKENYQPQVGDEAGVWYENDERFVTIKEIRTNGAILVHYDNGTRWILYGNQELFYAAIGNV